MQVVSDPGFLSSREARPDGFDRYVLVLEMLSHRRAGNSRSDKISLIPHQSSRYASDFLYFHCEFEEERSWICPGRPIFSCTLQMAPWPPSSGEKLGFLRLLRRRELSLIVHSSQIPCVGSTRLESLALRGKSGVIRTLQAARVVAALCVLMSQQAVSRRDCRAQNAVSEHDTTGMDHSRCIRVFSPLQCALSPFHRSWHTQHLSA